MLINPYSYSKLWTPAEITTALWLDADDPSTITQSSNLVSQVNDKSGNSRNFTATGTARPTLTVGGLNGRSTFTFSGSQNLTSISAASTWAFLHNSNRNTIWVTAKAGNSSDPQAAYWLMGTNAGTNQNVGRYMGYYDLDAGGGKNNNLIIDVVTQGGGLGVVDNTSNNDALIPNIPFVLSVLSDPGNATASARSLVSVNGETAIANNVTTRTPSTSNPTYTLQIGTTGNNVGTFWGYICEIVITASLATTATRQLVEGYMAWKWGIAGNLRSGHPYKSSPPTV